MDIESRNGSGSRADGAAAPEFCAPEYCTQYEGRDYLINEILRQEPRAIGPMAQASFGMFFLGGRSDPLRPYDRAAASEIHFRELASRFGVGLASRHGKDFDDYLQFHRDIRASAEHPFRFAAQWAKHTEFLTYSFFAEREIDPEPDRAAAADMPDRWSVKVPPRIEDTGWYKAYIESPAEDRDFTSPALDPFRTTVRQLMPEGWETSSVGGLAEAGKFVSGSHYQIVPLVYFLHPAYVRRFMQSGRSVAEDMEILNELYGTASHVDWPTELGELLDRRRRMLINQRCMGILADSRKARLLDDLLITLLRPVILSFTAASAGNGNQNDETNQFCGSRLFRNQAYLFAGLSGGGSDRFARALVLDIGLNSHERGRMVQRMRDIGCYRVVTLRNLQEMRKIWYGKANPDQPVSDALKEVSRAADPESLIGVSERFNGIAQAQYLRARYKQ